MNEVLHFLSYCINILILNPNPWCHVEFFISKYYTFFISYAPCGSEGKQLIKTDENNVLNKKNPIYKKDVFMMMTDSAAPHVRVVFTLPQTETLNRSNLLKRFDFASWISWNSTLLSWIDWGIIERRLDLCPRPTAKGAAVPTLRIISSTHLDIYWLQFNSGLKLWAVIFSEILRRPMQSLCWRRLLHTEGCRCIYNLIKWTALNIHRCSAFSSLCGCTMCQPKQM